ncbi:hypothetical protein QBC43DRAFT_252481 [Cladorrhinum sp. PSN259]|nr:hypothetical protein QBC43DRAFT_252481 [Cladorrhinum sp. PSN259]
MSRPTPRKSRHRPQPSSGRQQIQASDYESDTAYYMETRDMAPQPPSQTRSDMEINLSVLRRHDPTIVSILAIAANAVIYTFLETTGGWDKHGVEGTMFVCEQQPLVGPLRQPRPQACVFILNRRGMNNLVLDLSRVINCEVAEELLVLRLEEGYSPDGSGVDDGNTSGMKVLGIWMHSDDTRPRETNMEMIQTAWLEVRKAPMAAPIDENASVVESQVGGVALTEMAKRSKNASDATQHAVFQDELISETLQTQLSLVSKFHQWLQQHIDGDRDYQGIVSAVKGHIDSYKEWLLATQSDSKKIFDTLVSCGISTTIDAAPGGVSKIIVSGPGVGKAIAIEAIDDERANYILGEKYLGYMTKMCSAFSDAQHSLQSLLKMAHDVVTERAQLSHPAENTVQTHIRRLKDYNDIKDIGQQLIGLIAENRGVPIGGLYEEGQYGVTADD